MRTDLQAYINERARHLAFTHLAWQQSFWVDRNQDPKLALDLTVTVLQEGQPTGRIFGVLAKAVENILEQPPSQNVLQLYPEIREIQELPFPVYLMLFSMVNDRGYYCWLKPLTTQDGLSWQLVDNDGMQSIGQDVNAWYSSKTTVAA
jgi:hypothetical protein